MSAPAPTYKEVEPCVCGCGLGRHLPITGRPCEVRECGCTGYVKAVRPASGRWAKGTGR